MNNQAPRYSTKLTLKEYFDALGHTSKLTLSNAIGIPTDAIKTALRGSPIAFSYAQKIADYLAQEFHRDIQVTDITGLKTVNPGREKSQQSTPKVGN